MVDNGLREEQMNKGSPEDHLGQWSCLMIMVSIYSTFCIHEVQASCGDQRKTCEWVTGTELKSQGLYSKHFYPMSHLTSSCSHCLCGGVCFEIGSGSWSWTCFVAELLMFLPPPLKVEDYRCAPPCLISETVLYSLYDDRDKSSSTCYTLTERIHNTEMNLNATRFQILTMYPLLFINCNNVTQNEKYD